MEHGPEMTRMLDRLDVAFANGLKNFKFSFDRYTGWHPEDICRELNAMMDAYDNGHWEPLEFNDSNRI